MLLAPFVRNLRYFSEESFASSIVRFGGAKQTSITRSLHPSQLRKLTISRSNSNSVMSDSTVQEPGAAGDPPSRGASETSSSSEGGDKSAKQLKKEAKKAEKMEKFKKKQEAAKVQGEVRPAKHKE